jgi:ABC-type transport system involved in multi-copper enzyme maturation permease subunit
MTLLIARKELLDHLLSLKFHVSMAAMAVLLALSGYVMYRDYQLRMENYSVLRERARPRPGEVGVMAVVEPRPLSVFAKGLDDMLTRGYTVSAFGINVHSRQTPAESLFALFAAPDLLYIVKALVALIALLFAYDAVSGEKENGTLRLVLSGAVSRGQFIAGKMLGGLAAILLPFLVVLGAVLLAIATRPGIRLGSDELARLALMTLAALLYAALFFALGVLVSAWTRRSAGALMISLFLWAALVFGIPNVSNLVAEQIRPLPSGETQELLRRQEFAKNRFLSIQSRGQDPEGTRAAFNREYDRQIEGYRGKLDATIDLSKTLARVSPAATLSYIFTDLAGTGLTEQRRLTRALIDYKSRYLETRGTPPSFEFVAAGLPETLGRGALLDLAVLAMSAAALFALAVLQCLRLDPR